MNFIRFQCLGCCKVLTKKHQRSIHKRKCLCGSCAHEFGPSRLMVCSRRTYVRSGREAQRNSTTRHKCWYRMKEGRRSKANIDSFFTRKHQHGIHMRKCLRKWPRLGNGKFISHPYLYFSNVQCVKDIITRHEYAALSCTHNAAFHECCINRWLEERFTCPICRTRG